MVGYNRGFVVLFGYLPFNLRGSAPPPGLMNLGLHHSDTTVLITGGWPSVVSLDGLTTLILDVSH